MTIKTIRIFIFIVVVLTATATMAGAVRDHQVYPLPETETEDVVIQWLQSNGYHLHRSRTADQGVRLYAQKKHQQWLIELWPHSPLATRIKAAYTINGKAEPSQLQHLWAQLGDHMKAIMDPHRENQQPMPATIVSKTESVVCIYSGYPENPVQISGFIIDPKGLIICTAHGLKNKQQPITVVLNDGRQLEGRVIKMNKRYDLTLVDVNTELNAPILLSNGRDLSSASEPLYNIVCTPNADGAIFSGMVSGPPRKAADQLLLQVKMKIRPGSSGSPVFDVHGNLVAVVKGRYRDTDKVGFLIPFASLIKFLGDPIK